MRPPSPLPTPTAWPDPPLRWSVSALAEVEACPRRWALRRASFDGGGGEPVAGFPDRPRPATLRGRVVHAAVEEIVKALARAGCSSALSPCAGRAMDALGGASAVVARCTEAVLDDVRTNPRAAPVVDRLARDLRLALAELRDRVVPLVLRAPLHPRSSARTNPLVPARSTTGGRGGARSSRPRPPLGVGSHPETWVQTERPPFGGLIDLLTVTPDDVHVVDFKTGQPSDAHADQVRVYALTWLHDAERNPDGRHPTTLSLHYATGPVAVALPADFGAAHARLVKRVAAATLAVGSQPPAANVGPDTCGRCAVRAVCGAFWDARLDSLDDRYVDVELDVVASDGPDAWRVAVVRCPSGAVQGETRLALPGGPDPTVGARLRVLGARLRASDDGPDGASLAASVWTEVFDAPTTDLALEADGDLRRTRPPAP